ncbi:MAG: hypothetical protein ACYTGE_17220, partial [Planctomycetota bacterium]
DRALDALRGEARRRVTILWAADARPEAIDAPPFLAIDERRDRRWQGSLTGPVPQLIRWLHDRAIEDLAIGHPDLDSLFRRYYEQETDEP